MIGACMRNGVTTFEPAAGILVMIKAACTYFWQSESPECKLKLTAEHHPVSWSWKLRQSHFLPPDGNKEYFMSGLYLKNKMH